MALPMVIRAEIKNRRMVIEFPEDVADGEVTVSVTRLPNLPENPARDQLRAALMADGLLETEFGLPDDFVPEEITDEELEELGRLSGNPRPSEDLIAEDRGEY